jgi:hypothetical protein
VPFPPASAKLRLIIEKGFVEVVPPISGIHVKKGKIRLFRESNLAKNVRDFGQFVGGRSGVIANGAISFY